MARRQFLKDMDIPVFVNSNNNLPQIEQLWKKIKLDLESGFRVKTTGGHQVIRVYTQNNLNKWKFLLISSANNTMPPVFNVELNVYSESTKSWRLILQYSPIPKPNWSYEWQSLSEMYHDNEPVNNELQNSIINSYLTSTVDINTTQNAFKRINYHPKTATWNQK